MTDNSRVELPQRDADNQRPWQFSLLHLFGATTVIAVCAAVIGYDSELGVVFTFTVLMAIAIYYRTRAVIAMAPPSLHREMLSLVSFGVFTSLIWGAAAAAPFLVMFALFDIVRTRPHETIKALSAVSLALGFLTGAAAAAAILWRSWPQPYQQSKFHLPPSCDEGPKSPGA